MILAFLISFLFGNFLGILMMAIASAGNDNDEG